MRILRAFVAVVSLCLVTSVSARGAESGAAVPFPKKIVLIYVDDLGYGDVGCNGATRVKTPNIDRLAATGLNFTDGHATAATCTPSRFSLLTGRYAWRVNGTGILPGDAKLIIPQDRPTLGKVLQAAGYQTGIVGKWHLGLGSGSLDWNGEIAPGPLQVGFHECFLMPATTDRVPCVYVDQQHVLNLDPADPIKVQYGKPIPGVLTGKEHPELLTMKPSHGHDMSIVNGVSRIGYMSGGKAAIWSDIDMADKFTNRASSFLERHAGDKYFLMLSLHDIHVPRLPHPRFKGASAMGPRGDVIAETDWCVGRILETLEKTGQRNDTLVLFTSDNGPVIDDGYQDEAVKLLGDHQAAGPYRGGKYSAFEGGTRVPFIVNWPGKIVPGTSAALVSQVDFVATFAAALGQPVPEGTDSENHWAALTGQDPVGRKVLVEQAGVLSLREGPWKMSLPGKGPAKYNTTNTETGIAPQPRLYDLSKDIHEDHDVSAEHPDRVAAMQKRLAGIRGADSSN